VTKIAFYHLRNIAKVRLFRSQDDTERLIHTFVTSRLDYCNALLSGLCSPVWSTQESHWSTAKQTESCNMGTAQDQTESPHYTGFKVNALAASALLLVFKSIHDCAPQYMSDMLLSNVLRGSLGSSGTGLLTIPKPRTKRHGEVAFSYYAPSLWNSLTYLRDLETHIFLRLLF
jgi:hypothetical protein